MRTFKLTSPPMSGAGVTRLQTAMQKHGWLKGGVDGVYGVLTAQSAYRSKYWLGYAVPDMSAGARLLAYLEGRAQPTEDMKARAAARKKEAAAVPLREKALKWLEAHIGDKEHPAGSNRISWASEWYGVIGPWCAMAVTRAYVESGSKSFKRGQRYAFVPFIVGDATAGRNNLALTDEPKAGDLVCFDWQKDGVSDHVGLFNRWLDAGHTRFSTVEGNTAVGNDSNGGEVMRRERTRSQVRAFVHVGK